jgi:hypothetical protein
MTTFYDVDDLERQNNHLVGEIKDAKRVIEMYVLKHDAEERRAVGRECRCFECQQAKAWLARNKS